MLLNNIRQKAAVYSRKFLSVFTVSDMDNLTQADTACSQDHKPLLMFDTQA